ncbi:MAG: teichoic acid ABC transporter permease [Candidatus Reconcilbacillus cellulovorans]|uniref:Transport permease protein n=1 Tax=Candidatus Reconcilbacillus cellulovorans TaxID=1906605 RepID=A0A2A6DXA5_9BACL|nr:MAG: teichoic acid ABC transporter permease [Candidatus Reconcilbacillus cellulovorans]
MQNIVNFLKEIWKYRIFLFELSKREFYMRYVGSLLGSVWAFVHPIIQILILWYVFQIGFKSAAVDNFPFILWLASGMIPWFFFSESLQGATNSIIENRHWVKKIVFRISLLPLAKIITALYIHLFFVGLLLLMFLAYGYKPTIYLLQIFYYMLSMIVFVLGLSWATSSLIVFFRDIGQIISMLLQFGFWLTPIFYSLKVVPEKYRIIYMFNPMFYIVEGYRDSLIYHIWFWERGFQTVFYWIMTFVCLTVGGLLFKRLRPHFADLL